MSTPNQTITPIFKSAVAPTDNGGLAHVGTFSVPLIFENTVDGLDQIEAQIEHAGQEFKRQTSPAALEAADAQCSQLFQQTQSHLIKNGKRIDDLMGSLLRKRRLIVDYGARCGEGLWLASRRVRGWRAGMTRRWRTAASTGEQVGRSAVYWR